jgi:hypothetical protein
MSPQEELTVLAKLSFACRVGRVTKETQPPEGLSAHGLDIARDCIGMAAQTCAWRRRLKAALQDAEPEGIASGSLPRKEGGW